MKLIRRLFHAALRSLVALCMLLVLSDDLAADGLLESTIGTVAPRHAREIASSNWSIGGETLDRGFWNYDAGKEYLGPFGAKKIRLQGGWGKCEPAKGEYDFTWLDAVVEDALAQGVTPWIQFSYGNPIYEGGGDSSRSGGLPIGTPEAREAWTSWVRTMTARYGDRVWAWEVWNEFDWAGISVEEYTEFYMATADAARSADPNARLIACAMASIDFDKVETFLSALQREDKLGLVDVISFHSYHERPEDLYNKLPGLRELIAKYSEDITLLQGESGAPSTHVTFGALREKGFTETRQAKWDLRRMMGDLGHDLPSTLFTLSELKYPTGLNTKGLLRATEGDEYAIAYAKPAYDACRNVTAIFDDRLEPIREFPVEHSTDERMEVFAYKDTESGRQIVAMWVSDSTPSDETTPVPITIAMKKGHFAEPVFVDLMNGSVHGIAPEAWSKIEEGVVFRGVPVPDYPVLIAEGDLVETTPAVEVKWP